MDMDLVAFLEKLSRSVTLIPVSLQAPSPSELLPPAKSCAVLCCLHPCPHGQQGTGGRGQLRCPTPSPTSPSSSPPHTPAGFPLAAVTPRHRTGSSPPCTTPHVGAAPSEPRNRLQPWCPPASPSSPEPGALLCPHPWVTAVPAARATWGCAGCACPRESAEWSGFCWPISAQMWWPRTGRSPPLLPGHS